jgi:hypothetical protein
MACNAELRGLADRADAQCEDVAAPCFKWRCRIVPRFDQFSADAQHRRPGDDGDAFGRASIVAVNFGADRGSL